MTELIYIQNLLWWTKPNSKTEDDMLQYGFNVVLKLLLPDTIYQMNTDTSGDIDSLKHQLDSGGKIKAQIPDSMKNATGTDAFVINNMVPLIYPQLTKTSDPRFGFLNLNGMESRKAQFCPVTSIADSQPLCSIKTTKSMKETAPRALNYSMEMGLEAPIKAGTYSYYVSLDKANESNIDDYNYRISGVLTGPGFSYKIGDNNISFDLKNGPLSAVNTFYEILKNISVITRKSFLGNTLQKKFKPRHILRNFFESNIELLMKSGIKKSIGDYGQEFTALSKYGATTKDKYKTVNMITAGGNKTIPYNENGNAFRIMVANDRPSAYRGIFMLLFADQKTINTRSMLGYWFQRNAPKNTLVHGGNALLESDGDFNIRQESDADDVIQQPSQNVVNIVKQSKNKGRLKNVLYLRRSERQKIAKPSTRDISMFFRRHPEFKKWAKDQGIVIRPVNFKSEARKFAEQNKIPTNQWPFQGGGKKNRKTKKHKKRKRKTRKHKKRKRKTKKIKRKSYRKNKKSNKHKKKKNKKSKKRNKKR